MSKKEQIAELTAKGLTVQEIAKKVNLKVATVYTYQSMLRKQEAKQKEQPKENDKAEVNKVNSAATNGSYEKNIKEKEKIINDLEKLNKEKQKHLEQSQKDYKELQHKFKNLRKNYESLDSHNNDLRREIETLKDINEKLLANKVELEKETEQLKKEISEFNKVANNLTSNEELEQLREQVESLKNENQEMQAYAQVIKGENSKIAEAFKKEQKLHNHLLNYVSQLSSKL